MSINKAKISNGIITASHQRKLGSFIKDYRLNKIYSLGFQNPKTIIISIIVLTIIFASQLDGLRWETDARVYLPRGHEAILYDEKVDDIFGVKDTLIISIVNEEDSIYNPETLERISRITKKVASLPGVLATRDVDVASISTATVFEGDDTRMGARSLMESVPKTKEQIEKLKQDIQAHKEILIGNLVSADGSAAMIRVKIKEGQKNRYMTYFQVKGILATEKGEKATWGDWAGDGNWGGKKGDKISVESESGEWEGNQWTDGSKWKDGKPIEEVDPATFSNSEKKVEQSNSEEWQGNKWVDGSNWEKGKPLNQKSNIEVQKSEKSEDKKEAWQGNKWVSGDGTVKSQQNDEQTKDSQSATSQSPNKNSVNAEQENTNVVSQSVPIKDEFFLAGRPVIEVSSGLFAMEDLKLMVPLLIGVMALALLVIFRTWRGMLLPILVMSISIVWTFGLMVMFDVPLYTISTMLPVILVAVGIGDGVHLMSAYYDNVLKNPHEESKEIVRASTLQLGPPLIMTSVTTAIGFLALMFADMPPFKIFGIFALIGILLSWLISMTLLPAVLTLLKPKVGNYLAKKRAMRVYEEKNRLALFLTSSGKWIDAHRKKSITILTLVIAVSILGSTQLFVDSSWMSDFRDETDIAKSTKVLDTKFSGSIFLNVVIEAKQKDAFKNPILLGKMADLQAHMEKQPLVGDTISVVDYIKSMNKALNSGNENFNKIPDSQAQIAEYLFLFSVSGRPQQLDEVVDFDYKTGLITIIIQTDHTKELKRIIDSVNSFVETEFKDLDVDVNLSGSGNNSYIWADLLIGSQTDAIVLSKFAIFIVAAIVFASLIAGIYIVIPVTLSTLFVAGFAGLFSIPLDVSTALAAGIAIGVGVDYAVHYLFRYIHERKNNQDHLTATNNTLRTTGHTIVINAIVVSIGFSVLFFSQFPPHVKLGAFVTAYMVLSCLVAIFVLPAVLSYFRPNFSIGKS